MLIWETVCSALHTQLSVCRSHRTSWGFRVSQMKGLRATVQKCVFKLILGHISLFRVRPRIDRFQCSQEIKKYKLYREFGSMYMKIKNKTQPPKVSKATSLI